jgi:hypothetical protein
MDEEEQPMEVDDTERSMEVDTPVVLDDNDKYLIHLLKTNFKNEKYSLPSNIFRIVSLCFTMFSIYIVKITIEMYVKIIDMTYFFVQHLISYESFEYIFTCPIYDEHIGHVVLFERFPYVF